MEKNIYTFWEPKSNIPEYLKLCIKTWEKFLPNFNIIILDYSNLNDYLEKDFYDKYLYSNFTLPQQSDAIRAAILYLNGGIWLDIDTIITSSKFLSLIDNQKDFSLIKNHICFINANNTSQVLHNWVEDIKTNIRLHKEYAPNILKKYIDRKNYKNFIRWDYLVNSILNKYSDDIFHINDNYEQIFPEIKYCDKHFIKQTKRYKYFYFEQNFSENVLENSNGIICLHNSWTPKKYKNMPAQEFLNQKCMLSGILNYLLD